MKETEVLVTRTLKPVPLTDEAFSPYGDVIAHRGELRRHYADRALHLSETGVRPRLWVNRVVAAAEAPLIVDEFECHPLTSQSLIPMHAARFLVTVAPSSPSDGPDADRAECFITAPGQGVTYKPGIWHFGFTALEGPNEVVVVIGATGGPDDVIHSKLAEPLSVDWREAD